MQQAIGTTQMKHKIQIALNENWWGEQAQLGRGGSFQMPWSSMNRTGKGGLHNTVLKKAALERYKIPIPLVNERAKASPGHGLADFITRTCSSVPMKLLMIWLNGRESLKEGSFKDRAKIFDWGFDVNKVALDSLGQIQLSKQNVIQAFTPDPFSCNIHWLWRGTDFLKKIVLARGTEAKKL